MRRLPLLLAVLFPMLGLGEELRRADGTIFKADIVRAEPDGLVVQTEAGIEKIDFVLLSSELQKRFNYDRTKADEYRAKRVAGQQQLAAQQMTVVRAQAAAVEEKKSQQPSPEEAAKRLRIEQSVIFASASVQQGTSKGVRAGLTVQNGRAAATSLDKDTRTTTSLGEGFIYGLEAASGETWQGKIFPAGYYHFVDSYGEEQTMRAYALTVEAAMAHGAEGRGPAIPSVDPTGAERRLPGNLQGGTLLEKSRK